jgi:Na+-translocating ferredoxin:NAD+ oxidoreductase RnfC subunit
MTNDKDRITEAVRQAGVVGAGGAGFPTHVKLAADVDTIIVNGAECEPLIHVDKLLFEKYPEEVLGGLQMAAKAVGAKRVVIALKGKYKEAIHVLEEYNHKILSYEIFALGNFYPAGDEQVLVNEVTGKIVPEGGIPLMVGIVVINVETLFNVYQASKNMPVIETFVTVNGAVQKPVTLKVPVGTPARQLIDACMPAIPAYGVIDGGPMTGKLVDADTHAVTKTTKALLVLPTENIVIVQKQRKISTQLKRAQAVCLSCRMCTDLCPRYLLGHDLFPDELMKKMYKKELDAESIKKFDFAWLCCDCGLCELYSCVVDLSARSIFNYLKTELAKAGIKNPHTRSELAVNDFAAFRKVPVSRLVKRLEIDTYYARKLALEDYQEQVKEVKLNLRQHVGAPAVPVVQTGDAVGKGTLVADIAPDALGAKIHSPINGIVSEVTEHFISIKGQAGP